MNNQDNNSKYHIHNVLKDNQIIESVFRFKKIYSYLIPRKKTFISGDRSRKLTSIGLICLYCGYTTFNSSFLENKKHLQDKV
jgi:hypothetical protein